MRRKHWQMEIQASRGPERRLFAGGGGCVGDGDRRWSSVRPIFRRGGVALFMVMRAHSPTHKCKNILRLKFYGVGGNGAENGG
jgi:hypothetical protein